MIKAQVPRRTRRSASSKPSSPAGRSRPGKKTEEEPHSKKSQTGRKLKLRPYRHQDEAFNRGERNLVNVKGRRAGGTHGAALRLIELAHKQPRTQHLWIDTVQRNISKVVERTFLPLLKGSRYRWSATTRVLHFEGGATCDFGSAERPDTLEGFGYDIIWVNEAGIVLQGNLRLLANSDGTVDALLSRLGSQTRTNRYRNYTPDEQL